MKKHLKQSIGILMAVIMLLSVFVTANAESNIGTVTIKNPVVGQTYTIYRIFDVTTNASHTAYSYKVCSEWKSFIQSDTGKTYIKLDDSGYATWVEGANKDAFAKEALAYAKSNTATIKSAADPVKAADSTDIVFSSLPLGYYLVDSTLGTMCALTTTSTDAEVSEKNYTPTLEKKVLEGNTYETVNDESVGMPVEFRITVKPKQGAENYVIHDKMSTGLSFNNDVVVKRTNSDKVTADVSASFYTVTASPADGDTFDITFVQSFLDTLDSSVELNIYYSAKLTEDAIVAANDVNTVTNTAKLTFGDENSLSETPESTTTTYTWSLPIFKYTNTAKDDGTTEKTPLSGAKFILSFTSTRMTETDSAVAANDETTGTPAAQDNSTTVYYYAKANAENTINGWTENKNDAQEFTSAADGTIKIKGLDSGVYYLEETAAPDGYNMLASSITVKIFSNTSETGTLYSTLSQDNKDTTRIEVLNSTGAELPTTGGMGTTILYIVGGILVAGAGVFLIVRRRMKSDKTAE